MATTWVFTDGVTRDETNTNGTNLYVMCVMAMHAGIREITAENVEEVFRRISVLESDDVLGPGRGNDKGLLRFTLDECRSFIGISFNIAPYSARQFAAHVDRIKGGK